MVRNTLKKEIKPYQVKNSGKSIRQVFALVNDSMFQGYGADYTIGYKLDKIVVNPLFNYGSFLFRLKEMLHLEFVTQRDLLRQDCPRDKVRVSIRHDVDGDIVAAVKQAETEKKLGIVSTWFILHTAPYYGFFDEGVFYRHEGMGHIYRYFQDLGHEVALHTDPLKIYQDDKIDGSQAVITELQWLRSLGIHVHGTVAHNSKETYGAYNYEIFKGRNRELDLKSVSKVVSNAEKEIFFNGKWAPLQVLDEQELILDYEGNEVFWQGKIPLEYGATRALDQWRWNAQIRRIKHRKDPLDTYFIDQERLLADIKGIKPGTFLVFVVHPEYYGSRLNGKQSPPLRVNLRETCVNPRIGWVTYKPDTFQCWSNDLSARQEYQSINKSNMLGMIDKPLPEGKEQEDNKMRILFLGSDHIDGRQVGIPSQVHTRLGDLLSQKTGKTFNVIKLAFPGMGISRLWSWYEKTRDIIMPPLVLLGIDSQAIRKNVPLIWSQELGFSMHHPPGDYLGWDSKANTIKIVRASRGWAIRQKRPHRMDTFPGCTCPLDEMMADTQGFPWNGTNGFDFLIACYRFVCERIRENNAKPVLFVEESGETAGFFHERKDDKLRPEFMGRLNNRFESLATAVDVPLINPYKHFEIHSGGLPTHFLYDRAWNVTGHRLAAEAIFLALESWDMLNVFIKKM